MIFVFSKQLLTNRTERTWRTQILGPKWHRETFSTSGLNFKELLKWEYKTLKKYKKLLTSGITRAEFDRVNILSELPVFEHCIPSYLSTNTSCRYARKERVGLFRHFYLEFRESRAKLHLVLVWIANCVQIHLGYLETGFFSQCIDQAHCGIVRDLVQVVLDS